MPSYKPVPRTKANLDRALRFAVKDAAGLFQRELKRVVGKTVRRKDGASAPGQPPAKKTGGYQSTIRQDRSRLANAKNPVAVVGSKAKISGYLEFGTPEMPARPHWIPTFRRMRDRLTKRAASSIRRSLRRPSGA